MSADELLSDLCDRCARQTDRYDFRHYCDYRNGRDPSYDTPTDRPCPCKGPHYH